MNTAQKTTNLAPASRIAISLLMIMAENSGPYRTPHLHEAQPALPVSREPELAVLGKERMMIIELRGMLLHHLLCILHCVLTMEFRACGVDLLVWMIIDEEIFNFPAPRRFLVDSKARGELLVGSYLNGVKH